MMRGSVSYISFTFLVLSASAQTHFNQQLKQKLDSMQALDQKYRIPLALSSNGKDDSLAAAYGIKKEELTNYLWKLQNENDSLNILRIEEIIETYGYPGSTLVGTPTNEAAFYIIQHSKVIDKYLPTIENAAERKELDFQLYAMMLDRSLMFKNKEQIYGTQLSGVSVKNAATAQWETIMFIWPISDPLTVNERRKKAGFTQTVEEYASEGGIDYRVFTLKQVLQMRQEVMRAYEHK